MSVTLSRRRLGQLGPLLERPRFEVIPTKTIEETVASAVPKQVTITVTASPTKGLDASLDLAARLRARGYEVVPHLSARLVRDNAHLKEIVDRLVDIGVDEVFVPAGDADPPVGRYDTSLSLLEALDELGRPFARVGITGYPESHPLIDDDVTIQAMWDKRRHATYMVSNLCFDAVVLKRWIRRVRDRGVSLPLVIGIAGPVERTKLVAVASKIGVGDSVRFLGKHAGLLVRVGLPGGYSPERLLERLAPTLAEPSAGVQGLHLFTLNQVHATEAWRQALLAGATSSRRVSA